MGFHRFIVCTVALALLVTAGCGSGSTQGYGTVTVAGLATAPGVTCIAPGSIVAITGSGFLSEHGNDVMIRFTAEEGTPFEGGISAFVDTEGTAISDDTVQVIIPPVIGSVAVLVTITLPGGNAGTSPPGAVIIGGGLVGPFAFADFYDATGNVTLVVPVDSGVLENDVPSFCADDEQTPQKPAGSISTAAHNTTLTVVSFDATTNLGGSVAMNPDGSFTYQPPLGLGGTAQAPLLDAFNYTMEEAGRPLGTTFVQIALREVVWFVSDDAAPGGNGHFASPFNSLVGFNAVQGNGGQSDPAAGHWIFVYENAVTSAYDDGIVLLDDQKLIGQGVDLVVNGGTIVSSTANPVLTNTGLTQGADCIVLANRNRVDGVTVFAPTGHGIVGIDVAGPTTVDNTAVINTGGHGVRLFGALTGSITFGSNTLVRNAGRTGVYIFGLVEGDFEQKPAAGGPNALFDATFTFSGDIEGAGNWLVEILGGNVGSSATFSGGALTQDGGIGGVFIADSFATVTVDNADIRNVLFPAVDVIWANLILSNSNIQDITGAAVRLQGNVGLGGTGNTASNFGSLCDTTSLGTNVGVIDFGAAGTCP